MKKLFLGLAAAGCLGLVAPEVVVAPASAQVVNKTVTTRTGPLGRTCRTVRTAGIGPLGAKRVTVRRVCN